MFKHLNKYKNRLVLAALAVVGLVPEVWAAGPPKVSSMENPVVIMLVIVMAVLLLVILLLSNVLLGAAGYVREKEKERGRQFKSGRSFQSDHYLNCSTDIFFSAILCTGCSGK